MAINNVLVTSANPHLRASAAAAASAEAASAATSAAAAAAAAALFKVASNLWIAEASAVGPLPVGGTFYHMSESEAWGERCGYRQRLGFIFENKAETKNL